MADVVDLAQVLGWPAATIPVGPGLRIGPGEPAWQAFAVRGRHAEQAYSALEVMAE